MLKLSLNATLLDAIIHDSELGLEPRIFSLNKRCFNLLSYSERYIQIAVNIYKVLEPHTRFELVPPAWKAEMQNHYTNET